MMNECLNTKALSNSNNHVNYNIIKYSNSIQYINKNKNYLYIFSNKKKYFNWKKLLNNKNLFNLEFGEQK